MTSVWDMDIPAKQKLVLLALADCANDEGLAWPSIATLARKCGCDERTIQRNLRDIEKTGAIRREEVKGKGCKYRFGPPAKRHPRQNDGAANRPKTPGKLPPKPSGTVNGLSNDKPKRVRKPEGVDRQTWDDWKSARKGAPITQSVMDTVKREAAKLGWSVPEAIAHAAGNSWRGFNAEWVKDRKPANDYRNNSNSNAADLARQKLGLG